MLHLYLVSIIRLIEALGNLADLLVNLFSVLH
jgi:hypothetical protein